MRLHFYKIERFKYLNVIKIYNEMIQMDKLKFKVKTKMLWHKVKAKTKTFWNRHNTNPILQFTLMILVLLPFSFLVPTGLFEILYILLALFLTSYFILLNQDYFDIILPLSILLFIIAGSIYLLSLPGPFPNPNLIKNPLINFFVFFSLVLFMPTISYVLIGGRKIHTRTYIEKSTGKVLKEEKEYENMENSPENIIKLMFAFFPLLIYYVGMFAITIILDLIGKKLEEGRNQTINSKHSGNEESEGKTIIEDAKGNIIKKF